MNSKNYFNKAVKPNGGKLKGLLLLLPVIFLMVSCNNKQNSSESSASGADTTKAGKAVTKSDTTTGGSGMPAQVYAESTGLPISGATVVAQQNGQNVESATTDVNGNYSYKGLTNGGTYTFVASKTGWLQQSQNAQYEGTNSLPAFPMVLAGGK
jgi:hypothetical protein